MFEHQYHEQNDSGEISSFYGARQHVEELHKMESEKHFFLFFESVGPSPTTIIGTPRYHKEVSPFPKALDPFGQEPCRSMHLCYSLPRAGGLLLQKSTMGEKARATTTTNTRRSIGVPPKESRGDLNPQPFGCEPKTLPLQVTEKPISIFLERKGGDKD